MNGIRPIRFNEVAGIADFADLLRRPAIATAVVGNQADPGGSAPLASNAANSGRLIAVTPSRAG